MNAHDQVVDDLRTLLPDEALPELDDAARLDLEQRLYREWRDREPGSLANALAAARHWGPALVVAASLTAVLGLGAVVVVDGSAPPAERAQRLVAVDARTEQTLVLLAARASAQPPTVVGDNQYVYVRSTVLTNEGAFGDGVRLGAPHEREIWLSQDPDTADLGLIRELGQDWPLGSGGYRVAGGPGRPTYAWAQRLPSEPGDVVTELAADQPAGSQQSSDQYVFDRIGDVLGEGLVAPEVAETLLEAVTTIPGVRAVPGATDAIGRTGIGIERTDEAFGTTTTWVFRAGTAELLGVRWYLGTRGERVLFGATAVLERDVVDVAGRAPGVLES